MSLSIALHLSHMIVPRGWLINSFPEIELEHSRIRLRDHAPQPDGGTIDLSGSGCKLEHILRITRRRSFVVPIADEWCHGSAFIENLDRPRKCLASLRYDHLGVYRVRRINPQRRPCFIGHGS